MASGSPVKAFSAYAADFQRLSEASSLSYKEQLHPLIVGCCSSFRAVSGTPEEIKRSVQSVFVASHNVFVKFGERLTEEERKILLSFSLRSATCIVNVPEDVLSGLEAPAIAASLVMAQLAEKGFPENAAEMFWELSCIVVPLAIELAMLNFQENLFRDELELGKHFLALVLRHISVCGEDVFGLLCRAVGKFAANIGSVHGREVVVTCHWAETLEKLAEDTQEQVALKARLLSQKNGSSGLPVTLDAALRREYRAKEVAFSADGLCSQTVVERLTKITSALGNVSLGSSCLTKVKANDVQSMFDALNRIIEMRFRHRDPSLDEKKRILDFRTAALSGFCKMYPILLLERCERGEAPSPVPALTIQGALASAVTGLQQTVPGAFPVEEFLHHYRQVLCFAFWHYREIKAPDFGSIVDGLLGAEDRWHPAYPLDQFSDIWFGILDPLRGAPPASADGLQSLLAFLLGYIRRSKTYTHGVSERDKEALLGAADMLDRVVAAAAKASGGKRRIVPQFRQKILSALKDMSERLNTHR